MLANTKVESELPSRWMVQGTGIKEGGMPEPYVRDTTYLNHSTIEKATTVKLKLEDFYERLIDEGQLREQRRCNLEKKASDKGWSQAKISKSYLTLQEKESYNLRFKRRCLSVDDFKIISVIGRGAFGEVRLVQKKDTNKVYAMKTLDKSSMLASRQYAHIRSERDLLIRGLHNPWIVRLYHTFQDASNLYLIMEYLPGGDMMTLLMTYEILTEEQTRFYISECAAAIKSIHDLGYIHRDIKPDNILISRDGHIKLSDFGLSTGFRKKHSIEFYNSLLSMAQAQEYNNSRRNVLEAWKMNRRSLAYSTVGTADYVAPEVIQGIGYGKECDYWSLGAVMYECLAGRPPFLSDCPGECCLKIINWKKELYFPPGILVSTEALNILTKLLCDSNDRLNEEGVRNHPFFRDVNWDNIHNTPPPLIPSISFPTDTHYFPKDHLINVPMEVSSNRKYEDDINFHPRLSDTAQKGKFAFVGFTYKGWDTLENKGTM